jgi:hypothetical protein
MWAIVLGSEQPEVSKDTEAILAKLVNSDQSPAFVRVGPGRIVLNLDNPTVAAKLVNVVAEVRDHLEKTQQSSRARKLMQFVSDDLGLTVSD